MKQQFQLKVFDQDGTEIGEYFADLLVENCLIVELKAARTINDEPVAQIPGYLKAARIEHGLLVNFGSHRFQIRKYVFSQGRLIEKNSRRLADLIPFVSAFLAFFRG